MKEFVYDSPFLRRVWNDDNFSSLLIMGMRAGMLIAKFILSIFVARYMGLAELGIYGLIVGASGVTQAVLRGGVFSLLSRDVVHQSRAELMHDLRHYITGTLVLYLLLSPLVFGAGWYFDYAFIALLTLGVILTEHLAFDCYILLNNLQYPKLANFVFSLQSASWIYLFVIVAFFFEPFRSLEVLLAFWACGGLLALGIAVTLARRWPWKDTFARKMEWQWYQWKIKRSAKLYFADVMGVVNYYIDRYIVSVFLSLEMTGVYVFFSQVVTAAWNLINSGVLVVYAPRLIKAYDGEDTAPFNALYRSCLKRTFGATLALAVIAGLAVPFIVTFTDNDALIDHIPLLWIMLLALFFKVGTTSAGSGLFAMHKDREKLMIEVICLLITAIVGPVAVLNLGVYGIVLNTIIVSTASMAYARSVWVKKPSSPIASNKEKRYA